jgi:hypothetical protein
VHKKTLPMKRMVLQETFPKNKMKAHKSVPKLTLIEYDVELVAKKV